MDLEDWELVPKNPYKVLDLDDDKDHEAAMKIIRNTDKSFDMDYVICPTQDPVGKREFHRTSSVFPTQRFQVPINLEPVFTVGTIDHKKNQDPDFSDLYPGLLRDTIPSPRITFKTAKENEFVDMKRDLPVRFTSPLPQNDEKGTEVEEGGDLMCKKEVDWDEKENVCGENLDLWKMSLHGIGAICSFGVAAAVTTLCVFFLGHNNSIRGCRNKNKILRFKIYADDNKRINEVVKHATKINEAMSVMKGLPVARAQISFGGYYDAL